MFEWFKRLTTPEAAASDERRGGDGDPGKPAAQAGRPASYEANVLLLFDTSLSVGQKTVDYTVDKGIPAIARSLANASMRSGTVYNMSVRSFSSDSTCLAPFVNVREEGAFQNLPEVKCTGVTMMEEAMWAALADIDRKKADQDQRRIPRAGSIIVVVTDGKPTNEHGELRGLSDYLVREIAERNRTRSCETFVIGMGSVDEETLRQLGPSVTTEVRDGTQVEIPHAVHYLGDQHSMDCWNTVYRLIGDASSSVTGKRVMAYQDEHRAWTKQVDPLFVARDEFRIVK